MFQRLRYSKTVGALLFGVLVVGLGGCKQATAAYDRLAGTNAPVIQPSSVDAGLRTAIYSYVNDEGRTVYVDHPDKIPAKFRNKHETLNVSHVSLNNEVARDLERQVLKEHKELAASPFCGEAQYRAKQPWWKQMWHSSGYLLLIAFAGIFILGLTPIAIQSFDPSIWTRFMTMAFPSLLVIGVLTYSVVETSRVKEEVTLTASLCDPGQIKTGDQESTQSRIKVVQMLRTMMQESEKRRSAILKEAFRDTRLIQEEDPLKE
jgi:hypothetical protein